MEKTLELTVRVTLIAAALLAFLAVLLGAFGAHGLKASLSPQAMTIYHTAVTYQFYHALGLLAVGLLLIHRPAMTIRWAGRCLLSGTVIFSGSLYLLALTGTSWVGAITPVGGILLLIGWGLLALGIWQMS